MSADIESWPEKAELERWLMNTVKDPDPGALFLRQVLQMNPAYGGYLQTDKDLVQIVQLTAKRLRARMMSASGPLSPSSFYEPLCEMTWRITGHLLHAVLVLDSTAANSLPVPKEPLGQVKMLVQTNMELSQKLNMMRRDYLRELTSHRDKQRTISDEAHGVLESLQENPVMFFEPLKFVLDDVTKEFIKLVVEERVKLDQKGAPVPKPERKPTREMTNPKAKTSEKEKALQDDLNKVRSQLAKLQEAFKESEIQVRRLDAAEKSVREQLERAEEQRSNAARQATAQSKAIEEELRLLRQQLEEKDRAMDQLKAMGSMEEKSKMEALAQRTKELSEAKAAVAELTSQVAKVNEELSSLQQQLKEADEMRLVAEALAKEAKAKVPQAPQVEVTEDKSEALAEELGEALEAAKTLRKEKGQLEKALEEARAVQANLRAQLAKKQEASPKVQVEVQEEPAPVPPKEETPAPRVVEVAVAVPNEDLEMWKDKCTNLEDEKVDLENQIADLTQQVKILTEKLQEVGGEQAILEVQEKIKLAIPRPPKKKKPKRAYERLWQDAQRRIIAMRVQAKVLEKNQEQQIVAWRKNAVANENSMKIIESISRMHHDASTSQTALNQAMEDYSIETAPDQEVHDVWDDDEADETPSPVSGAKYNFETEEGMELNEADEVEVLRTELLHRQQELRALKQEVAVLRRTLEMCTFHWKVMLLDFLGFIGTIAEWVHLGESAGDVPSASLWMMLFHCAKMWRFLLPTVLVLDSRADSYTRGVASSFLWLVFLSHAAAIVLLILAVQERAIGVVSWIDNMVAEGQACGVIYIESVYFAALSITSVGYGDILVSPLERACNAFLLILGQLFVAKICADVTWLTSLHNLEETKNQSQKAQTSVALKHLQVPIELTERVLAYQIFVQHVHREEDLDQPAFHGLSTPLMQELRLAAYRKLILKAPFLREQKKHVISMMVSSLSDLIYLPADFIVCSGDTGRELFFMRRGVAGVYPSGPECPPVWGESSEVAEYTAGKYFGELGMLTARPRAAWIMAKTYCVLSVLPYHTVELLRDDHPEAFTTLVQSMVRVFKLEPSTTWQSVAEKLLRKMSFTTTDEAFRWFCEQGYESAIPEEPPVLKAKSFEYVLKFLGVNEADRMILWAEMDADNTGQVTKDEFEEKLDIDFAARKYAKALAAVQSNPLLRSATTMHLGATSSGGNLSSSLPARIKPNGEVKFQRHVSKEAEKEEMYQLMKDTVRSIAEEYYSGDKKNRFSSGSSPGGPGPRVHFPPAPSQPAPERPVEPQKST